MDLSELRYHATTAKIDETEIILNTVLTNSGILLLGEDLGSISIEELDSRISSFESTLRQNNMKPNYYWKVQFGLLNQGKIR